MDLLKSICWPLIFIIRIRFPPGKSLVTSSSNVGNLHLLVMLVQNKRLYGFLACIFDENSLMCPSRTQKKLYVSFAYSKETKRLNTLYADWIKQSGILDQNKTAVRFLGV